MAGLGVIYLWRLSKNGSIVVSKGTRHAGDATLESKVSEPSD